VQLTHLEKYGADSSNFGYKERQSHVKQIREGATCYLVMCLANDRGASPRDIKSFNKDSVFVGGELKQYDSDWWIEVADKIPSHKLMQKPST
jgi:hypothetical protein